MRDTELLRARLLVGLGLVAVTACAEPEPEPASAADGGAGPADHATEIASGRASESTSDSTSDENPDAEADMEGQQPTPLPPATEPFVPEEGEFDYFGVPRDPYEDHDEEEGCPQGDWCGPPEVAEMFSVPDLEPVLECPRRLMAKKEIPIKRSDRRLKGLSQDKRMQGRLVTTTTEAEREKGRKDVCCYHWFEYCSGRPLRDEEDVVVAELREGASWTEDGELPPPPPLDEALRDRLARGWLEDAQAEHASVAAFARVTLELMALGAPPELLADVQQAALDEVRHAERCFALAARYGARREPGPMPVLPPRAPEHRQLALDTFVEGCVGETIAALVATRCARHVGDHDPVVGDTWRGVADDEGRHAALAWRILAWSLEEGGPEVVEAVREQAEMLRAAAAHDELDTHERWPELRAEGRPDPRLLAEAGRDAWNDIIMPTLRDLIDGTRAGS